MCQGVCVVVECGWEVWVQQIVVWDDDVQQWVEVVVEEYLWVEDYDQVDVDEYFEYVFVQIEVYWVECLCVGVVLVEVGVVFFVLDCQFYFEGIVVEIVIVDLVFE